MTTDIIAAPASSAATKEALAADFRGVVGKADHLLKDATHTYVCGSPWRFVGLAAAVGVVIGALITRR
jgi:ElaB/YqjD/DUF883 family membrane-anchored ribosome-binding protein